MGYSKGNQYIQFRRDEVVRCINRMNQLDKWFADLGYMETAAKCRDARKSLRALSNDIYDLAIREKDRELWKELEIGK